MLYISFGVHKHTNFTTFLAPPAQISHCTAIIHKQIFVKILYRCTSTIQQLQEDKSLFKGCFKMVEVMHTNFLAIFLKKLFFPKSAKILMPPSDLFQNNSGNSKVHFSLQERPKLHENQSINGEAIYR